MQAPFRQWAFLRQPARKISILVIDDFIPDRTVGFGVPRSAELLRALAATGSEVALWPIDDKLAGQANAPRVDGVEIVRDRGGGLEGMLSRRETPFDAIIVSRPHNMKAFKALTAANPELTKSAAVIYDAEALFAERDMIMKDVLGMPVVGEVSRNLIDEELALAGGAKMVLAVNASTAESFKASGHGDVRVLGYAARKNPTATPFEQRHGFLFVGPTRNDGEPNSDAVVWFVDEVLPRLRMTLGRDVSLRLAGMVGAPSVMQRAGDGLDVLGVVADLTETYARARVFVAPTRFASGVPLKVYDAAAHGVPTIVTPLLARNLGWKDESETLVADGPAAFAGACVRLHRDPDLWHHIRARALKRVSNDCNVDKFDRIVTGLVSEIQGQPPLNPRA
jgi:glycosyltransferase involved in cell wall biosynthesis